MDATQTPTTSTEQNAHDAALIVAVREATISDCQAFIRETADSLAASFERAGLPLIASHAYRSAADLLEGLRK